MTLFTDLAPRIMTDLIRVFDIEMLDAAAIVGNLGHESGGFKSFQEIKPLVPGSKGGYGWAQWTGPRRKQFEKYCADAILKPESYEANFGFLVWELQNTEKKALPAVVKAKTLFEKVKAFENSFERSRIKHYDSRNDYAMKAMRAYETVPVIIPVEKPVEPAPTPVVEPTPVHVDNWFIRLLKLLGVL